MSIEKVSGADLFARKVDIPFGVICSSDYVTQEIHTDDFCAFSYSLGKVLGIDNMTNLVPCAILGTTHSLLELSIKNPTVAPKIRGIIKDISKKTGVSIARLQAIQSACNRGKDCFPFIISPSHTEPSLVHNCSVCSSLCSRKNACVEAHTTSIYPISSEVEGAVRQILPLSKDKPQAFSYEYTNTNPPSPVEINTEFSIEDKDTDLLLGDTYVVSFNLESSGQYRQLVIYISNTQTSFDATSLFYWNTLRQENIQRYRENIVNYLNVFLTIEKSIRTSSEIRLIQAIYSDTIVFFRRLKQLLEKLIQTQSNASFENKVLTTLKSRVSTIALLMNEAAQRPRRFSA